MAALREFRRKYLPFVPSGGRPRQLRDLALNRFGLQRTHQPRRLVEQPTLQHENLLRFVAADYLLRAGHMNIVQVGAFDGVIDDDLSDVLQNPSVQAALSEPQPGAFHRLSEKYAGQTRIQTFNAAMDRETQVRKFYGRIEGDTTVASFDRDHVRRQGIAEQQLATYDVQCLSLDDVLERAGFEQVDLLQIDAEGYDFEILDSIDFAKHRPAILRFEFCHYSSREVDACVDRLAGFGYQFVNERKDLIALHRETFAGR